MIIDKLTNFKRGWIVGHFSPTIWQTHVTEVAVQTHQAGSDHAAHYHTSNREINVILDGTVIVQGKTLGKDDIFVIEPYEVCEPHFVEDCRILVVRTGSTPSDKFLAERPPTHPMEGS